MVQQNLVSYILTQLRQGRRLEDINKFLIESGYNKAEVESSIQYVINTQTNPQLAEQQRIQQLSTYIQQQIKSGYNQQTIANFLMSRGYPYYEVNSALQQATVTQTESKVGHKLLVAALIVMFVMTTAVSVMYFKAYTLIGVGVPDQLLDVETERLTTIVQQGGDLSFQVKLINFGYEKRFDVELNYQIIDRETQGVVLQKTETLALSTTLENIVKFEIPDEIKSGKYVLRVDATYKEFIATSGFIFDILPKEVAEERLEEIRDMMPDEQNESEIPELAPEVEVPAIEEPEEGEQLVPTPITPVPEKERFYKGKTRKQALELVKSVSVREPQRAIDMCKEFLYAGNEENCLTMLAVFKKADAYCAEIERTTAKDQCYIELARETKNYELCSKISVPQLQNSCKMFEMIDEAQGAGSSAAAGTVDTSKMFDLMVTAQQN